MSILAGLPGVLLPILISTSARVTKLSFCPSTTSEPYTSIDPLFTIVPGDIVNVTPYAI